MAVFTPTSWVYLLDTPLDNTYKNELHFDTINKQREYFNTRIKHKFQEVTYNRKDNSFLVEKSIDSLYDSNYVTYCNESSNHWFYAFITNMEYVSENVTRIFIETDVYQTWLFDCTLKKSFVVREHVNNDAIGMHLVEEGLDLGDYVMNSYQKTGVMGDLWFVVAVSDTVSSSDALIRRVYGNVYSGLAYIAFSPENTDEMNTFISNYTAKPNAIQFIFTIPANFLPVDTVSGDVLPSYYTNRVLNYNFLTFSSDVTELNKFKSLNNYTPVNNKMYCYPYNLLYVSNNNGASAEFHFEDFEDFAITDRISFRLECNVSPNPTVLMYPYGYRLPQDSSVDTNSYEYAISLSGFPLCSWGNDLYGAWLAQNGGVTALSIIGASASIGAGVVTANPMAVGGGALAIASQMSQIYKASIQPDQAKGNTSGANVNISGNRQDFFVSRMTIKYEYAKRIDDYFTMFGYKINELKVPNTHCRENWNYIQTIDINIDGAIPSDDMRKLKSIYNNGITLWHKADNFCQYEMSNNII